MPEDLKGGRIYSNWWWVLLVVTPDLEARSDVQLLLDFEAGVSVTQSGEHLSNQPYGILNRAGLYVMSAGGNGAYPVL